VLVPDAPSRLLICVTVPVTVSDDVPVPDTEAPLSPTVAFSVPSVTDSVTVIEPEPARLPPPAPKPSSAKAVAAAAQAFSERRRTGGLAA